VLGRRDQLPLGPHANRVLVHRLVDDRERHKSGQSETLQADADLGGALSDEVDVRRGGDDFVDSPRALFGTDDGELKRQTGDRRQLVSVNLRERGQVRNEIRGFRCRTKRRVSFGNWPSSLGSHLSRLLWT